MKSKLVLDVWRHGTWVGWRQSTGQDVAVYSLFAGRRGSLVPGFC